MNELGRIWEWFADTSCKGYSPIYDRICRHVADDDELLALMRESPPPAHQPSVILGVVHYLLLGGLDHPLAAVYAGESDADPGPLFHDVCLTNRAAVLELMETRRTQTNECGRSAVIGPALTWVARHAGAPIALLDVGTSAGLNLGHGLDRSPIDLTDELDARWMLACIWPDTGRLERTSAAIRDAQRHPPTITQGDMVEDLPAVIAQLPRDAVACVTTTWALAYLTREGREQFAAQLVTAGRERPIVWISGESPGIVRAFADHQPEQLDDIEPSVLGAIEYEGDATRTTLLAYVHPHGANINWLAPS